MPRKRARIRDAVGGSLIMEGYRALLPVPQAFAPAQNGQGSRAVCSGAASTSGRPVAGSVSVSQHGVLAHLYRHRGEIEDSRRAAAFASQRRTRLCFKG